jgi:DNA polymerase-3 subunit gamma/tau
MSEQYKILANKYRPQTFSEVVGQDALVQTLKNEIENNKIHHAFILTGIRGIGKTTTARLIAKSLNCLSSDKAVITPCLKCEHCTNIAKSNDSDVIEFDAASHTGVDDIRQIIDSTSYGPINSRYKIFIIDEVHMLSKSAFNALLKTLEEPPQYIKFIFATTEIRKIPITILSRCQRFDLRRLGFEETVSHLKNICNKEGFEVEDNAINILANFSEGSVRDSLSLLDRALGHNNYQHLLTEKSVIEMLGLSSKKNIYDIFSSLLEGNTDRTLEIFNDIYNYSTDINNFLQDLLEVNHNTILAKTLTKYFEIVHLPTDQIEIIKDLSKKTQLHSLMRVWRMLLRGEIELKSDFDARKTMEIILINICYGSRLPSLPDILNEKKTNPKEDIINNVIEMFSGAKLIE